MKLSERPEIDLIEQAVLDTLGFSIQELRGKRKQRSDCDARIIMAYLIRKAYHDITLKEVGEYLSRHYSTIIHYALVHSDLYENDRDYTVKAVKAEQRLLALQQSRLTEELDMFAIYKPNGHIEPQSISNSEFMAWARMVDCTITIQRAALEEMGWECRPVKITVTSTKS